jgi:hypothetical protein
MPADQRLGFVSEIVGKVSVADREQKVRKYVDNLYEDSKITSRENAEALLAKDADDIKDDELVKLAARYNEEQGPVQTKVNVANNKLTQLRTRFAEGWMSWKKSDLSYPDANRTLRLTYGEVRPFSPRDAVEYRFATTLSGVMEKETGEAPFIVPTKLKELWMKKDFGRYADPQLKDVPVAFITDNDITGGNSGSAVINGNGEIIGCAFDGNWEGIVGDYFFEPKLNRTISVDARYVLFVLDKFSGAENILKEMTIH